jgi:hypothetical protein
MEDKTIILEGDYYYVRNDCFCSNFGGCSGYRIFDYDEIHVEDVYEQGVYQEVQQNDR